MATEIKEKKDSTVLEDNHLLCVLTNQPKKISAKENNLQSVILMLNEDMDIVDVNNDGIVSYKEYYDVIYDTSYFTDIDLDSDNYISEYELAEFVFTNWDKNDNGVLSEYEFNRFKWYYLDV